MFGNWFLYNFSVIGQRRPDTIQFRYLMTLLIFYLLFLWNSDRTLSLSKDAFTWVTPELKQQFMKEKTWLWAKAKNSCLNHVFSPWNRQGVLYVELLTWVDTVNACHTLYFTIMLYLYSQYSPNYHFTLKEATTEEAKTMMTTTMMIRK